MMRSPPGRGPVRRAFDALRMYFGLGLLGGMGLLWSLLAVPLYYLLPAAPGRRLGRGLIRLVFRVYLRALAATGACRFDLSALDALRGAGALIVAPNHPSLIDAVLVLSRLPQLGCIMKASIVDNPSLGAGARLARYIRNDSLRGMIGRAVDELRQGRQLLLFPEGTRSSARPVGPLRGSVGVIARQAQVPVQTVLIESDSAFLGKDWPLSRVPRLPITYTVRLGRRFAPPRDAHELVAQLDAYYRQALSEGPDGGAET